jgi:hypothetical protein
MQLLSQLSSFQFSSISQGSLAAFTVIGAILLIALAWYLGRLLLSFLNPVSSRLAPLFALTLACSSALAALLCVNSAWLPLHFPGWKSSLGALLLVLTFAGLAVAAARFIRYALVVCTWGAIFLVLGSHVFFNRPPEAMLRENMPRIERAAREDLPAAGRVVSERAAALGKEIIASAVK